MYRHMLETKPHEYDSHVTGADAIKPERVEIPRGCRKGTIKIATVNFVWKNVWIKYIKNEQSLVMCVGDAQYRNA